MYQGGRTGDASPDGLETIFSGLHTRVVVDGIIECWHSGEVGWVIFMDVFQNIWNVTRIGNYDHAGADCHGVAHPRHHAVNMKERDRHQEDFPASLHANEPTLDLEGVRHHVAVQGHRTFGNTGCPAGVLEQGSIVRSNIQFGTLGRLIFVKQILHPHIAIRQPALDPEPAFFLRPPA